MKDFHKITAFNVIETMKWNGTRTYKKISGEYKTEYTLKNRQRVDLVVFAEEPIEAEYWFEFKSNKHDLIHGCPMKFYGDYNFLVVPEFTWNNCLLDAWHHLHDLKRDDVGILSINKKGEITCWRGSMYRKGLEIGLELADAVGDKFECILI